MSILATSTTDWAATRPSKAHQKAVEIYPLTGRSAPAARVTTGRKRCMLDLMEAFMFLRLKVSLAAVKTAILSTLAARAPSSPRSLGTSAE